MSDEPASTSQSADTEAPNADKPPGALVTLGTPGDPVRWASRNPAAHRARRISLDPRFLVADAATLQVGDRIRVPLFDGQSVVMEVTHSTLWGRDQATLAVRGNLEGAPHGFATLTSTGGTLRAWIKAGADGHSYQIRHDPATGGHLLLEIDHAGSEILACGNEAFGLDLGHVAEAGMHDDPSAGAAPSTGAAGSALHTIGVMAVYTPAAKAREGGLAGMEANISQSMLLGNTVLSNSMADVSIDLVHSEEVNYQESSSPNTDLQRLRYVDGIMDKVHTLRDLHGADFVVFFIDTEKVGGLGYRASDYESPDMAFCLVRVRQSDTESYTTIHEIGHNMGNGHSKTQRVQAYDGSFVPYAAGWQWADAASPASLGYCSIMTYENFDSSGDKSEEYVRVPYFSNPQVDYNGSPTGHPEDGDAARVIRDGGIHYVAYREPMAYPYAEFPYRLGFEAGEFVWLQSDRDEHDWSTAQSGSTPSVGTGPTGAQSGSRYAYIEASNHYQESAVLEADFDFSAADAPVIRFSYHMRDDDGGGHMGALHLEASLDSGQTWETLFAVSGGQGDVWQSVEVALAAYARDEVRLRFRGVTGAGFRSDIAIDGIELFDDADATPVDSFAAWMEANYPDLDEAAPTDDADGDGQINFIEYALGTSPDDPAAVATTDTSYDPFAKTIRFSFVRARAAVRYEVQTVTALSDWDDPVVAWASDTAGDLVPLGELQEVVIDASPPMRFVRLVLE